MPSSLRKHAGRVARRLTCRGRDDGQLIGMVSGDTERDPLAAALGRSRCSLVRLKENFSLVELC